ncbi:MAG: ABC transporter ATP-binding protein [Chloroflexi bacterium]|nr:ABC transporter ATP-binding protein [Chloroflexota bacterium]
MIEVENVSKRYGDAEAVRDVSFRVDTGEVVGFVGPNGAGKTTTMKVLACLMPPTAGIARIAGFDTVDHSADARRRLGYLPESVPLYTDMTVRQYLSYMAALRDVPKARRAERVSEVIAAVGTEEYADRRIGTLSKGFRQRVGIGQAVIHEPAVVILDEPTSGLDPAQRIEMRSLITNIGREHAVLLSSHILSEVALGCDRIVVIDRGRVVADGTLPEITAAAGLAEGSSTESVFLALTGTGERAEP